MYFSIYVQSIVTFEKAKLKKIASLGSVAVVLCINNTRVHDFN